MEDKDWTVRANVRELVASHGKILKEAADNGVIEQGQLDVNDDVERVMAALSEEDVTKFSELYAEETGARVAQLNQTTAQLQVKAAETEANANYIGSIIGAIIAVTVIFLLLRELL